jgi:hypothetical protein
VLSRVDERKAYAVMRSATRMAAVADGLTLLFFVLAGAAAVPCVVYSSKLCLWCLQRSVLAAIARDRAAIPTTHA